MTDTITIPVTLPAPPEGYGPVVWFGVPDQGRDHVAWSGTMWRDWGCYPFGMAIAHAYKLEGGQ